eukprot:TRINITY_DN15886_c0_g1_i1.p1 TRINITY_DN15886_c0_g1~~TRINITY_DN15886_c0_g1_i1.p1  ORF type:complete len:455 (+),score=135.03 TRINITY_DN15886_c0_g1_i1:45-1367(+)
MPGATPPKDLRRISRLPFSNGDQVAGVLAAGLHTDLTPLLKAFPDDYDAHILVGALLRAAEPAAAAPAEVDAQSTGSSPKRVSEDRRTVQSSEWHSDCGSPAGPAAALHHDEELSPEVRPAAISTPVEQPSADTAASPSREGTGADCGVANDSVSPEHLLQVQRLTGSLLGRYKELQTDYDGLTETLRARDARVSELESLLAQSEQHRAELERQLSAAQRVHASRRSSPPHHRFKVGDLVQKRDGGRTADQHAVGWVLEGGEPAEVTEVDADGDVRLRNTVGAESGWHFARYFTLVRAPQSRARAGGQAAAGSDLASKRRALAEAMRLLRDDPPSRPARADQRSATDVAAPTASQAADPQFRARRPPPYLVRQSGGWRQPHEQIVRPRAVSPCAERPLSADPPARAVHPGHYEAVQPARSYTPKSFPCARTSPRRGYSPS